MHFLYSLFKKNELNIMFFLCIFHSGLYASVTVKKIGGGALSVSSGLMEMAFDAKSGDLFVSGEKTTHTISKISRSNDSTNGSSVDTVAESLMLPASHDHINPQYMNIVYVKDQKITNKASGAQLRCLVYADRNALTNNAKLYVIKTDYVNDSNGVISSFVSSTSANLKDATNSLSAGKIVGITCSDATSSHHAWAFVAVAPNSGNWGSANSGIVKVIIQYDSTNALTVPESALSLTVFNTVAFDSTTTALFIQNTPASIGSSDPLLHFNADLQKLYVGLKSITSGAVSGDGVKSVVIGSSANYCLLSPYRLHTVYVDYGGSGSGSGGVNNVDLISQCVVGYYDGYAPLAGDVLSTSSGSSIKIGDVVSRSGTVVGIVVNGDSSAILVNNQIATILPVYDVAIDMHGDNSVSTGSIQIKSGYKIVYFKSAGVYYNPSGNNDHIVTNALANIGATTITTSHVVMRTISSVNTKIGHVVSLPSSAIVSTSSINPRVASQYYVVLGNLVGGAVKYSLVAYCDGISPESSDTIVSAANVDIALNAVITRSSSTSYVGIVNAIDDGAQALSSNMATVSTTVTASSAYKIYSACVDLENDGSGSSVSTDFAIISVGYYIGYAPLAGDTLSTAANGDIHVGDTIKRSGSDIGVVLSVAVSKTIGTGNIGTLLPIYSSRFQFDSGATQSQSVDGAYFKSGGSYRVPVVDDSITNSSSSIAAYQFISRSAVGNVGIILSPGSVPSGTIMNNPIVMNQYKITIDNNGVDESTSKLISAYFSSYYPVVGDVVKNVSGSAITNVIIPENGQIKRSAFTVGVSVVTSQDVMTAPMVIDSFDVINGAIVFTNLTSTDSSWGNGASNATNNFIGIKKENTSLSLLNMTTMKTPDGKYYLIINGGVGVSSATYDSVIALPLVSPSITDDITGSLAKYTSGSDLIDFDTRATSAQLLSRANSNSQAINGQVAGGDVNNVINCIVGFQLPPTKTLNAPIVSLFASSESVFALIKSTKIDSGAEAEGGLFVSHAFFDIDGVITRWGAWNKVDSVYSTNSVTSFNSSVIDAPSGKIYTIMNNVTDVLDYLLCSRISTPIANSFPALVNSFLQNSTQQSVLSVLRNNYLTSFVRSHISRYFIASSDNKVALFRLAKTPQVAYEYHNRSLQIPITDFSTVGSIADNQLITTLPSVIVPGLINNTQGINSVNCLGYGYMKNTDANNLDSGLFPYVRGSDKDRLFLFAGTNDGLFVLGNGFSESDFYKDFDQEPWKSVSWVQVKGLLNSSLNKSTPDDFNQTVTTVKYGVRAIKTIGQSVYILVRKAIVVKFVYSGKIVSQLSVDQIYRFDENMDAAAYASGSACLLIASNETGNTVSSNLIGLQFNDFVIVKKTDTGAIASGDSTVKEFLFLLTDQPNISSGKTSGLFKSTCMDNVTTSVPTWSNVDFGGGNFSDPFIEKIFPIISSACDGENHTLFLSALPVAAIATRSTLLRLVGSRIQNDATTLQYSVKDWSSSHAVRGGYIDYDITTGIGYLPRLLDMYNDGLRRILVTSHNANSAVPELYCAPYRTDIWGFSTNTSRNMVKISSSSLNNPDRIYWIVQTSQGDILISTHNKNGNQLYII